MLRLLVRVLVVVLLLLGAGLIYVGHAITATPDLGGAPAGANHGENESSIAQYAVLRLAALTIPGHPHETVSLSEHDLTIELQTHAPTDGSFRDGVARVRGSQVVVSGLTTFGPFGVVGVGRLSLAIVTAADGQPDIGASIDEIDAGTQRLPDMARRSIADRVTAAADLNGFLEASPALSRLRPLLECVAVRDGTVVIGFHQPGLGADPTACGGGAPG